MTKKTKTFIPLNQMSRKDKIIHFLKIFGISFASVIGLFAGITLYVWATGGFNPPYEPLTSWAFSQNEYVIDGNKYIDLDEDGNQKIENDNLVFVQKTNTKNEPIYESVMIVPNEGCTELDAEIKISFSSNPNMPVVQLVEDDNTKALDVSENDNEENFHLKYSVKIGSPIYVKPVTTTVNQIETNVGGWVMLTATQGLMQTSCWVFVDVPVQKLSLSLDNGDNIETTVEDEESPEEIYYNVSWNSNLHITNNVYPNSSFNFPKSNVPSSKIYNNIAGATGYLEEKKVIYEISDSQIAQIDENGNITISRGKENQTFYVTAYTISKYNDLQNVPTIQQFEDDENRDPSQSAQELYKKAINKIIIRSNKICFKIKDIQVEEVVVNKNMPTPTYNVFEDASINFSNTITSVSKNNYFVDLVLSDPNNDIYKNELLRNVKLVAVYENESVQNETQNQTNDGDILSKIKINGHNVISASNYLDLKYNSQSREWQYLVKQYAENNFYFVFYYELEDEILYNFIPFSISKVAVTNLETTDNSIYITLKDREVSKSLVGFEQITPTNSTYKDVKYFIPAENNAEDYIVDVDLNTKIKINNKDYVAVAKQVSSQQSNEVSYNYNELVAKKTGKTTMIAVVLRTIPDFDENTGEKVYNFIINDGFIDWEYYSNNVTIIITKDVEFTNIEVTDEIDVNDNPNPDHEVCDVYKEVYQGGKITINLTHDGLAEYLDGDRMQISLLEGGDATVASIINIDNTSKDESGNCLYKFDIQANNVGRATYQVKYKSGDGDTEKLVCTVVIIVLPIDLVGIELDAEDNQLSISYQTAGNKITGFSWGDLELQVKLNSPKSLASYELVAYQVPNWLDISLLEKYKGLNYTAEINELDDEINSIEKLISMLSLSNNIIQIGGISQSDEQIDKTLGGNILVGENRFVYTFNQSYKFDSSFAANLLIVAKSYDGICSNPLLITVKIPEIVVNYGQNNQKSKTVYSQGLLTTYDGSKTAAKSVDIYQSGADAIKILTSVNGVEYDLGLSDLINFSFSNNKLISTDSKASIEDHLLTFADVSSIATDVIIAYTNFGYCNESFYTYNIIPDFKPINNRSGITYTTPNVIDLFDDFEGNGVYITNAEFNISSDNLKDNKLFLPYGYEEVVSTYISQASDEDLAKFLNKFYYADDTEEEPYYHIYCNLSILESKSTNASDYRVINEDGIPKIRLNYNESSSTIYIYIETEGGYQINQITLKTEPGVNSKFSTENSIPASGITDTEIDILKNLNFEDKDHNSINDGNYTGDFGVDVTDIQFAITRDTNADIWFYKAEGGSRIEGYTQFEEDVSYLTKDQYDVLQDEEKTSYKAYYILTGDSSADETKTYYKKDVYEKVESPTFDEIANYYELVEVYKKTEDLNIVAGRTYYKQVIDGDLVYYEIVEEPINAEIEDYYVFDNIHYELTNDTSLISTKSYYIKYAFKPVETNMLDDNELDSYYELVYSNKIYFEFVEAYYEEVSQDELDAAFLSRYYIKNGSGDFECASGEFDEQATYYYRYTYRQIEQNNDISDAYFKYTINLVIERDASGNITSCKLVVSPEIIEIEHSIYLAFSINVQITNNNPENSSSSVIYKNYKFNYKLTLEGYND